MRALAGIALLAALLGAVLWIASECKGEPPLWLGPTRVIGC